uniref:Putative secreted protein n=1 Tax=Anopheles marajoara TaxID=58244 RepID=A0A2M4CFL8_9DIPT
MGPRVSRLSKFLLVRRMLLPMIQTHTVKKRVKDGRPLLLLVHSVFHQGSHQTRSRCCCCCCYYYCW